MARIAIDTNVLAIANRLHDNATEECIFNCGERLLAATESDVVLVDLGGEIFAEYRGYASARGSPGLGDVFMKWLWDNRANTQRCCEIELTPYGDDYAEFPGSLRQAGFDLDDRKFVAVAKAGSPDPLVVNGIDRGYVNHYAGLQAEGVDVEFLCPECVPDVGA